MKRRSDAKYGSPVSPVMTALVHRDMFDEIFDICESNGLKMSVWVDDLTISGNTVCGALVEQIRAVIRKRGFRTHKIEFRTWSRPVVVTGVPIIGHRIGAPRSLHRRVEEGYSALRATDLSDIERSQAIDRLLSALGTHRYHVGSKSPEGRKSSNRMEALRQRRAKLDLKFVTLPQVLLETAPSSGDLSAVPWE